MCALIASVVAAPVGSVGPDGGGALEPPLAFAMWASCALVPLKRFMSTWPPMPLTEPLLVRCQNVQVLQPPGTLGLPVV